jgi:hypothetical protein
MPISEIILYAFMATAIVFIFVTVVIDNNKNERK